MYKTELTDLFAAQHKLMAALWAIAAGDRQMLRTVLDGADFRMNRAGLHKDHPARAAVRRVTGQLNAGAETGSYLIRDPAYRAAWELHKHLRDAVVSRETTQEACTR